MLTHLHIRNYALISELDIDFGEGMSVLTGETGAGKSIILGALNLVMGGRADTRTITEGEERCVIEAEFDEPSPKAKSGNTDTPIIIRRELNVNGRSRSFVNDEVVTQSELKALAARLIDIHSQHANLLMADDSFQLSVVDAIAFAHGDEIRAAYSVLYDEYCAIKVELQRLTDEAKKAQDEADYVQFQYNQLQEANLQAGEQESLEQEEYRLAHAEEIRERLEQALQVLDGDDGGILSRLQSLRLTEASPALAGRLSAVEIELDDIKREAQRQAEQTESDPERLQQVQDRISLLQQLLHKHHVKSAEELIALRDRLAEQCRHLDAYDEEIEQARKAFHRKEQELFVASQRLTDARLAVREMICSELMDNLHLLGIAHAQMDVQVMPLDDYTPVGRDNVQFMFAANLNQTLRRVSEVASGGEISRIMLCIKALTASTRGLPTIIFDEIDTGISGEVATAMGRVMQRMAATRQIIAITHLPQIAAAAGTHYQVYKADTDKRTETHIHALNEEERVTEIATMLAGRQTTQAAKETARELLKK